MASPAANVTGSSGGDPPAATVTERPPVEDGMRSLSLAERAPRSASASAATLPTSIKTTTVAAASSSSVLMVSNQDDAEGGQVFIARQESTAAIYVEGPLESASILATAESLVDRLAGIPQRAAPLPSIATPTPTPPQTGHLLTLSAEQRERLFQLWELVIDFLLAPENNAALTASGDPAPPPLKGASLRASVTERLGRLQHESHRRSVFSLSEAQSTALDANPLTDELFFQCSTDDPDRILLRFLRARKWIVTEAFTMLIDCLRWRSAVGLRELMYEGERRVKLSLLEGGKNYFWKRDRAGHLVCYIRSRLHDRNAQTLQESIDFTIYTVEVGRRLRDHDEQLVTIVFDLKDAPLASLDIPCAQFMISTLQSYYPEILSKCLIMEAPWIFSGFWKLARPLLDPIVASKIEFIKRAELDRHVDPANIPAEYGGEDPFVFRYVLPDINDYPRVPSEAHSQLLLARIEVLKSRFIEATQEINSLITRVEEPTDLEMLLLPVRERRDGIKDQLRQCYRQMDRLVLPKSYYHRIGVVDEEGRVEWSRYGEPPPPPECRASAPPILSPAEFCHPPPAEE